MKKGGKNVIDRAMLIDLPPTPHPLSSDTSSTRHLHSSIWPRPASFFLEGRARQGDKPGEGPMEIDDEAAARAGQAGPSKPTSFRKQYDPENMPWVRGGGKRRGHTASRSYLPILCPLHTFPPF